MRLACYVLALACVAGLAGYSPADDLLAGVGRVDITPSGPIWMVGYASRKKASEGVDQALNAKALVLQQGQTAPFILITADLIGFPRAVAEEVAGRIEKEYQVPRANVLLAASHTHTGPLLAGNLIGMADLAGKERGVVEAYTRSLPDKILTAVAAALKSRAPARLAFGRGRATFAVNRRVFRPGGVNFGVNPDGPVDHEVLTLRVEGTAGDTRAVVFGYACHCTTLGGDYYRIGGDWAGYAQAYLERTYPGATALFVTGCGADANPEPRGKLAFAREHGLEMAGAVSQALRGARTAVNGPLRATFERVDLPLGPLPSREEYQKRAESKDPFVQRHARHFLRMLERGEKLPTSYPCPVQVWQFGNDLTLVALGGEVVVDYAARLKRELKGTNLWVAAYANDVFAYVPSVRILLEGGYEADYNLVYYGLPTRFSNRVEDVLIQKVHQLIQQVRQ
jgi:hypothetical protein